MSPTLILKKGREKSVINRHPWIFSGAIHSLKGTPDNGDYIRITSSSGELLGTGFYSPNSQIRARIVTFGTGEPDENYFKEQIHSAYSFRNRHIDPTKTDSFRLFFSESDGIPGVIIDKYNDVLSCQFLSAGAQRIKPVVIQILNDMFHPTAILEHADEKAALLEGFKPFQGLLSGTLHTPLITIKENDLNFIVDVSAGQKTGFFLDQRENRQILRQFCDDTQILNCFSYSAGFSIYAVAGGARNVISVDSSSQAIELAKANIESNEQDPSKHELIVRDVFQYLNGKQDGEFDIIILDPPAFIKKRTQIQAGARGYQNLNRLAMKLLKKDGLLFTFSCSHFMDEKLFRQVLHSAGVESGRNLHYVKGFGAGLDHPVSASFPESAYLKGYCIRVF
ncbi:MAG: class I SAM-dependent rRNA methyltransferase [Calditrichaceae bacterium]